MAGKVLSTTVEELQASLERADPPTSDDVSITLDGRRLDSKEAVLVWLADVDDETAAERYALTDSREASFSPCSPATGCTMWSLGRHMMQSVRACWPVDAKWMHGIVGLTSHHATSPGRRQAVARRAGGP